MKTSPLRTSWFVSALAGLGLAWACARIPAPRAGPPNVLVLYVDDMGYADLGVTGNRTCPTPNLDSLAENGVLFTGGYSTGCVCSPARVALLTGRYQQRFGFEANTDILPEPRPVEALDPAVPTFADRFRELGYRTGIVGKWHIGSAVPELLPNARGFDEFYGILPHAIELQPPLVQVWRNHERVPSPKNHMRAFGAEAEAFIERHAAGPWFLYCAFTAVHGPHEVLPEYRRRFAGIQPPLRANHQAALACLDDVVGDILATLHANGLDENTLIFLASDNGAQPPSGDNGAYRGEKWTLLEGGIRTPILVQWKGHIPGGGRRSELVTQLDWLPTALAAAGVEPRPEWQLDGANLLPLLRGESTAAPHDALFWRFGPQFAVRRGTWKLVKAGLEEPTSLYDLQADPGEQQDLSSTNPAEVRALQALWDEWNRGNLAPRWTDQRWNRLAEAPAAAAPPARVEPAARAGK